MIPVITVFEVTEMLGIERAVYANAGKVPKVRVSTSFSTVAVGNVPALHDVMSSAAIAVPALAEPTDVVDGVYFVSIAESTPVEPSILRLASYRLSRRPMCLRMRWEGCKCRHRHRHLLRRRFRRRSHRLLQRQLRPVCLLP